MLAFESESTKKNTPERSDRGHFSLSDGLMEVRESARRQDEQSSHPDKRKSLSAESGRIYFSPVP
jgi:hypothetical protein